MKKLPETHHADCASDPLDRAVFMAFANDTLRREERAALARALAKPGFVARCLLALERKQERKEGSL